MSVHAPLLILDAAQIEQKINRLAYQIYEQNFEEKSLIIGGISERGYLLAQMIHAKLKEIADFDLELCEVVLEKDNLNTENIQLYPQPKALQEKAVILCDDVLYSGKTLAYATVPFIEANVKKLQCLVLIQRSYQNFPVHPTYVGLSLASTLQEHVSVNFSDSPSVYLG